MPPAELLHVGDDYHLDIVGALNVASMAWVVRDTHREAERVQQQATTPHVTLSDLSMLCRMLGGPDDVA